MSVSTRDQAVQLREIVARNAITDLIYRYCRSMDRMDAELGYSIFHEDATADYDGFYNGSGRGAIDAICASHRHATVHTHQVTSIILDINGDRAASESYHLSALRIVIDGKLMQITTWGRYLDRWSCRDGRWGIDHRMVVRDLDEIREATPMSQFERGRRDESDPSYALFRDLRNAPQVAP